jgi:hypothetical protein
MQYTHLQGHSGWPGRRVGSLTSRFMFSGLVPPCFGVR